MRVITDEDGAPLVHVKDVCVSIGHTNPSQALADKIEQEDIRKAEALSEGCKQLSNFVTESGLYALIFGSMKPQAKRFKRWVTSMVLPAIRKTGRYEAAQLLWPT